MPTRAPVTHNNGNNLAGAWVYGEPWLAYLKASPSLSLTTTRSYPFQIAPLCPQLSSRSTRARDQARPPPLLLAGVR